MFRSDGARSGRTALVGVLAAGGFVFLWMACLTPTGRIGLAAVAGLFPMVAVLAAGRAAGYLCWATIGLLGLVMLPGKELALLFCVFLGLYPVAKSQIEQINRQVLEWPCKLIFFNGIFILFWLALKAAFLRGLPQWLEENKVLLLLTANGVFLIYDIGLSRLISMMSASIKRWRRY